MVMFFQNPILDQHGKNAFSSRKTIIKVCLFITLSYCCIQKQVSTDLSSVFI